MPFGGQGFAGAIPTHPSSINPLLDSTSIGAPMFPPMPMAAPMMPQEPVMTQQTMQQPTTGHWETVQQQVWVPDPPVVHQEQVVHRHAPVVHEQTVEVAGLSGRPG